jgi:hypothetical protein
MKIVETHDLLNVGPFAKSKIWKKANKDINAAIKVTDWPHGTGKFTIYPESGKKRGEGNGVDPIKNPCMAKLKALGWKTEKLPPINSNVLGTGDLDGLLETKSGFIGFEWETGNVSSSHRAINKLLLTLKQKGLIGGILVVPSNKLKKFLTDRIGNIGELEPYFPLWKSVKIKEGALRIIVVEHDKTSLKVPRIPKRTDGRAKA